jgi:hypothetical protein
VGDARKTSRLNAPEATRFTYGANLSGDADRERILWLGKHGVFMLRSQAI